MAVFYDTPEKVKSKVRGPAYSLAHVLVTYADGSQEEWALAQEDKPCGWLRKGENRTTKPDTRWDTVEIHLSLPHADIVEHDDSTTVPGGT